VQSSGHLLPARDGPRLPTHAGRKPQSESLLLFPAAVQGSWNKTLNVIRQWQFRGESGSSLRLGVRLRSTSEI